METIETTFNMLTTAEKITILNTIKYDEETIQALRKITKAYSEKKRKEYTKNYYKKKYNEDDDYKERMKNSSKKQYQTLKNNQNKDPLILEEK